MESKDLVVRKAKKHLWIFPYSYYVPHDGPDKTMRHMPKSLKGALIAVFHFVLFHKHRITVREDAA